MKNNQPLVSIIIVTWNRKEEILDALEAIGKQSYSNIEVVVVDNGSSDGTIEEIKRLYKSYKLVCLPSNIGCEEGFNVGIVNSTGSILIYLDSDAFFEDEGVQKIVDKFNDNPSLGIVDPRIYNFFSNSIQNEPKNWPPHDRIFTGCAVGIRREVIDNTGLRPGNYFIYASEADISIRALDFGYKIEHFKDILAYHKESPTKRLSPKFFYYNTRNNIWLIFKHYPLIPAFIELFNLLVINLFLSIKSLSIHYYLLGFLEGLIKLPIIIKNERKPLKRWYLGRLYPNISELLGILRKKYVKKN